MDYLNISDTQVTIGEERIVVSNPAPLVPASLDSYLDWSHIILTLEERIAALQLRVEQLEQRTFWSLFKDWAKSLWHSATTAR